MTTMTSSSMSFVLDEIVTGLAVNAFYRSPFMLPLLFNVRGSSRRRERFASVSGLNRWAVKNPTAAASPDNLIQQFEKDFVHTAYGQEIAVEREFIDDQEFGILEKIGDQIGYNGGRTMELDAVAVWDDFTAGATHKAEDGLSVCNNAHLNVDGANSQDNLGGNSLDTDGLNATRVAMRGFKDYRGNLAPSIMRLIVVPTALQTRAQQLARSEKNPDNAQNTANVFQGLEYVVWDLLSSTSEWFGIDPGLMMSNLLWLQRIGIEIYGSGDLFTGTRKIGGYTRYSRGVLDWRFVYGNAP